MDFKSTQKILFNEDIDFMEKSILEIRILSGLQAGASLTLPPGEYLLGTSEACDIVLNDRQMQSRHALLVITEEAVAIHAQEGGVLNLAGEPHEGEISAGELFRAGNTWFVLDAHDSPWPDMDTLFAQMKPAELRTMPSASPEEPGTAGKQTEAIPPFSALEDEPVKNERVSTLRGRLGFLKLSGPWREKLPKALLAAGVLGIAILCLTLALMPRAPDKTQLAQQASSQSQQRIEQLLQDMHLKQRVNVTENKQGKLVVSGYLAKDADMLALVDALAKLNSKPELRLFSEEAIVNAANQILLTAQMPVKASNLGMGRIQLVGAAGSYENADTLIQKMNAGIDGLRGVDSEILVGDQLVAKLRQMIVDNGLAGKVALTVNKGEAIINGTLDMREMAQWEQVMAQFVSTYGSILPIRASFPPTANILPFRVLSAFSGDMPFIVTENGEKVMLGGHIQGYTLVNITEQEIIFDGPRKVQIQR